jgi:hypothetical protein
MKDTPNRRLTKRFDLMVPALVTQITTDKGHLSQLCLTRDISSQGAFIGLMEPLPDDGKIEIQLLYPLKNEVGRFEYVQMSAIGTVVRREANGLAVSFDEKTTLKPFHIEH